MKRVLFFTDLHSHAHAKIYAGVCERAREYNWHVIEIEYARTDRPAEDFLNVWKPEGAIVECSYLAESLNTAAYSAVPTVFIEPPEGSDEGIFTVRHAPDTFARAAFDELTLTGPAAYAFVNWTIGPRWSKDRAAAFTRLAEKTGKACYLFTESWLNSDQLDIQRRLADWLRTLPKPCGVFAANDRTAVQVIYACEIAQIDCPGEITVLGVDNDEFHCENTRPSLSSIEPDFMQAGRIAADLLQKRLRRPALAPVHSMFDPSRLVRRASTAILKTTDLRLRDAIDRIRRDACHGLTPADVIRELPFSRRLAELRFRETTGRSIGEEINERRFEHVFHLLENTDTPIGAIASACGWECDSYLKRAFKRRTGMTMRAWRNRNQ